MPSSRATNLPAAVFASIVVFCGLALLTAEIATWFDTGRWVSYSFFDFITAPLVKPALPEAALRWLVRPTSLFELHDAVAFVLAIPAAPLLLVLGAVVFWRARAR